LQEQYLVVSRYAHQLAQIRLGLGCDFHEGFAAVTDFHDRHAVVVPVQHFVACLFQDFGRQRRRARREIEHAHGSLDAQLEDGGSPPD
jgi:hypothetical protein